MAATPETARARWFPGMPPHLDGEDSGAYTDRLTGADRTGRIPYDHHRYRQCSIGHHGECSQHGKADGACECPCHTLAGALALSLYELRPEVTPGGVAELAGEDSRA